MFLCVMKTCFYSCILQKGATRYCTKYNNGQEMRFRKTYQTWNEYIYKIVFWALESETKLSLELEVSTANDGPLTNTGMCWSDLPPTLTAIDTFLSLKLWLVNNRKSIKFVQINVSNLGGEKTFYSFIFLVIHFNTWQQNKLHN